MQSAVRASGGHPAIWFRCRAILLVWAIGAGLSRIRSRSVLRLRLWLWLLLHNRGLPLWLRDRLVTRSVVVARAVRPVAPIPVIIRPLLAPVAIAVALPVPAAVGTAIPVTVRLTVPVGPTTPILVAVGTVVPVAVRSVIPSLVTIPAAVGPAVDPARAAAPTVSGWVCLRSEDRERQKRGTRGTVGEGYLKSVVA